jgi:penicillin-binding protein 1A
LGGSVTEDDFRIKTNSRTPPMTTGDCGILPDECTTPLVPSVNEGGSSAAAEAQATPVGETSPCTSNEEHWIPVGSSVNKDGASPTFKKPRQWKRILLRVLRWSLVLSLVGAVVVAVTIWLVIAHYEARLPSVQQLRTSYRPAQVTRVLGRDGSSLAEIFTERRTVIPFSAIPIHTRLAFLAAEDAHFYEHEGLNYLGVLRAIITNLRAGRMVQGGSTITQQVVKNVLLVPERTLARKIQEAILARRLEQSLTKDEILGLYLNHIYLGHGRYGIEEAARLYFGKHASELDLAESALLAGIVASPERYSPRRDSRRSLERRRFVLTQMQAKGFASPELVQTALLAPLLLLPLPEEQSDLCPEAVAWAMLQLQTIVGEPAHNGGYVISTTIDPTLQATARRAVRDNLNAYAKRHGQLPPFRAKKTLFGPITKEEPLRNHVAVGVVEAVDDAAGTLDVRVGSVLGRVRLLREEWFNPTHLPPSGFAEIGATLRVRIEGDPSLANPDLRLDLGPQSALVAIDARSREILALVGSREAVMGDLDRTGHMRRQPGSSFKPIMYAFGLSSHQVTPSTIFDVPADPKHPEVLQRLRLRDGLARSHNGVAQALLARIGAEKVVGFAHLVGISSPLSPTPSLALGAYEVSPLEITNAFATFASGGLFATPILIREIKGPQNRAVPLPTTEPPRRVMTEEDAYLITSMLRSVVDYGTGQRAKRVGRPVVGKTGTTNQAKDTWFVGYSPELVVGVWVGYDDASPLGREESGGTTALPAWTDFVKAALSSRPATDFARPAGIIVERIDPETGLLAQVGADNAMEEEFLAGTARVDSTVPPEGGVENPLDAGAPPSSTSDTKGIGGAPPSEASPPSPAGGTNPTAEQAPPSQPEPFMDEPTPAVGQGGSGPTPRTERTTTAESAP